MKEMSQLYSRVFLQILDSSIAEDFTTRHVFEDFLKLCDHKHGVLDMTRQSLSRRLNCPLETLNDSITKLESPDPSSRDLAFEGRRIERLDDHRDWGWRILNWGKYDGMRTKADVSLRVARHREKTNSNQPTPEVPINDLPVKFQTERLQLKWKAWQQVRRDMKKCKNFSGMFNEQIEFLSKFDEPTAFEILSQSIRNGWQGLFELKPSQMLPAKRPGKIAV